MQKVPQNDLSTADLIIDAVYEGGRSGNAGDDPLHQLTGVSNQGGFRYLGNRERPRLIVLISNFGDPDWPDRVDSETGIVVYFGDNKQPGRALHDTPRNGNNLLRQLFDAVHRRPTNRSDVPPVLLFGNAGPYRDMKFLGLLVPGAQQLSGLEDLVAVWKTGGQQRFQNYRAVLTILDVPVLTRQWLVYIKLDNPLSANAPAAWREWRETGKYRPLRSVPTLAYRSKKDQLPEGQVARAIVGTIRSRFADAPVLFEECAAKLVQLMDSHFISCDITRPSRDGGRDAVGLYRLGYGEAVIQADYALEAKCYSFENSVGTRELSRLISRLRHRQFGVIVTTSYVHHQAYQEIREDQHPVIVVSGRDIVAILAKAGLTSLVDVKDWIAVNFPEQPAWPTA